jgi:hypothetical protein
MGHLTEFFIQGQSLNAAMLVSNSHGLNSGSPGKQSSIGSAPRRGGQGSLSIYGCRNYFPDHAFGKKLAKKRNGLVDWFKAPVEHNHSTNIQGEKQQRD